VEGDVEVVRVTVPVKLFTGDTVVVKELDPPELNVTLDGFAATVKSG